MSKENTITKWVDEFNHLAKTLATGISKKMPNDAVVAITHKLIVTAINLEPLTVIGEVGPHLYKYRTQIWGLHDDQNETYFLDNDYSQELSMSTAPKKRNAITYLIPKMKECVRSLPHDEKREYKNLMISLLDAYIEYLTAVAEEKK